MRKTSRKRRVLPVSGAGSKLRLRKTPINPERTRCLDFGRSGQSMLENILTSEH